MILAWNSRKFAGWKVTFAGLAWVISTAVPVGWTTRQTLISVYVPSPSGYDGGLTDDSSMYIFTDDNSAFYLTWG